MVPTTCQIWYQYITAFRKKAQFGKKLSNNTKHFLRLPKAQSIPSTPGQCKSGVSADWAGKRLWRSESLQNSGNQVNQGTEVYMFGKGKYWVSCNSYLVWFLQWLQRLPQCIFSPALLFSTLPFADKQPGDAVSVNLVLNSPTCCFPRILAAETHNCKTKYPQQRTDFSPQVPIKHLGPVLEIVKCKGLPLLSTLHTYSH